MLSFNNGIDNGCELIIRLAKKYERHSGYCYTMCLPYETNGFDIEFNDGIDPEVTAGCIGTAVAVWENLQDYYKKRYDHMDIGYTVTWIHDEAVDTQFHWIWHGWKNEIETCTKAVEALIDYEKYGTDC